MVTNQSSTPPMHIWLVLIIPLACVVLFFALTSLFSPPSLTTITTNATTILSIVGGVAVGIERIIEAFWSFLDMSTKNHQWPLSSETFTSVNTRINEKLDGFVDHAKQGIDALKQKDQAVVDVLNKAVTELENSNVMFLGPGVRGSNFNSISATVLNNVDILRKSIPDLNTHSQELATILTDASEFVDTLKNNPGRRLFSILLGIILGLLVAWLTGLDLFQATLGPLSLSVFGFVVPHLGAAVTGVTLGLGASPTHEVIQLLSQLKQKTTNPA